MLRIIDANLNRIGEGLRLLEDVARFVLDDAEISQPLKRLRHDLVAGEISFQTKLLSARRVAEDVGASLEAPGEGKRGDLPALVVANARRVQESLRVMEELAKLPELSSLGSERFKQARFQVYDLEQKLVSSLLRRQKLERLSGLYVILDAKALGGRSQVEVAQQAIRGGARAIQLRDKGRSRAALLPVARELQQVCAKSGALFIVNDYLDLALACHADGLHLGQEDLPLSVARKALPVNRIVGLSAATLAEAVQAQAEGADYVGVGAIYPTPSKPDTRLAGLETLRQVRRAVSLPLVAIGGIQEENVAEVIAAGADAVAVISAVLGAEDVEGAARRLAAAIEAAKPGQPGGVEIG